MLLMEQRQCARYISYTSAQALTLHCTHCTKQHTQARHLTAEEAAARAAREAEALRTLRISANPDIAGRPAPSSRSTQGSCFFVLVVLLHHGRPVRASLFESYVLPPVQLAMHASAPEHTCVHVCVCSARMHAHHHKQPTT